MTTMTTLTLVKSNSGAEAVRRYLKESKKCLNLPARYWREYSVDMIKELEEFREAYPSCTYNDLVDYFDDPKIAVEKYICETDILSRERFKIGRYFYFKVLALGAALLLGLSLFYAYCVLSDQAVMVQEHVVIDKRIDSQNK